MNFIDQAKVKVNAGKGGDGLVSFRRERFVAKGGPDGGDGGDGGDVVLKASNNQNSLAVFRYSKQLNAAAGQSGGNKKKHGKTGKDLIVSVPIGTEAKDSSGQILADLTSEGQESVIAIGGKGGFGNAHFVSSRRQAPGFAEKGEPGEALELTLELKLLADVGLVGLPNAGKSTLLGSLSNARPKVADYPFTTIIPSVGVVDVGDNSLLFADIPGLIEGAAKGKGLGHDFLRHIERTSVIVHLIDIYAPDIEEAYETIRRELAAYSKALAKRPEIVAVNKIDGLDPEITADAVALLKKVMKKQNSSLYLVSAKSGQGLKELVYAVSEAVMKARKAQEAAAKKELYEYLLPDDPRFWEVQKSKIGQYLVNGPQIERFARRTDFSNDQAVARLMDILRRRGVLHALVRKGIKPGDKILIGDEGELTY